MQITSREHPGINFKIRRRRFKACKKSIPLTLCVLCSFDIYFLRGVSLDNHQVGDFAVFCGAHKPLSR